MLNGLTFGQLDSICLDRARLSDQDIYVFMREIYINNALMKLYRELDGVNDPFYNQQFLPTVAANQENLTASSVDTSLSQITRASGTFQLNSIATITEVTSAGAVNGQVVVLLNTILNNGLTAAYTVLSGNLAGVGGDYYYVSILKTLSVSSIDTRTYYIKKIVSLFDGTGVTKRRFYPVDNPERFNDLINDPQAQTNVYYYWRGDFIDLYVGINTSIGVPTMEVITKPNQADDTTQNQALNFPPEFNQMLIEEVTKQYLIHVGKMPSDPNASQNGEALAEQANAADNQNLAMKRASK